MVSSEAGTGKDIATETTGVGQGLSGGDLARDWHFQCISCILTPMKLTTQPPFATWYRRAACHLLDQYLLVPLIAALFLPDPYRKPAMIALMIFWVWSTMIHQGRSGRSVGRMVTHTRLVDVHTHASVGFWRTFIRSLVHTLDFVALGIGFLWPLWDAQRQTWADKIMSTVVLYDDPRTAEAEEVALPQAA